MEEQKKLSATYKMLRALGFNYSEEEYGQVSLRRVIKQILAIYIANGWKNDGLADTRTHMSA